MDSFLIDFNSPKQSRENTLLIPESLVNTPFAQAAPVQFMPIRSESNPFDLVECQVAANTAAENDPFEIVLNNAMKCQESNSNNNEFSLSEASYNLTESPKAVAKRMSTSLPDLQKLANIEPHGRSPTDKKSNETKTYCELERAVNENDCNASFLSSWNCLEDIPPPESLLNSTVDMSCFLDDTFSTSIINVATLKDTSVLIEENTSPLVAINFPTKLKESHQATYKSDEELRLMAQKKIENIINKAEQDVQSDIEESLVQRRRSIQSISNPSQELLALCTPRKQNLKTDQPSWSLDKWSENELKKLDLIFPDTSKKSSSSKIDSALAAYLDAPILKLEENLSLNSSKMVSSRTPLKQVLISTQPPATENNCSSTAGSPKKTSSASSPPVSPNLLPLPLCEDAVRNLSLCSKYSSPDKNSMEQLKTGNTLKIIPDTSKEQAKLTLRKPTIPPKTQPKMAPMKATAPVQNMTRIRSSLHNPSKPIASTVGGRKSMPKESCPKPTTNQPLNGKSLRIGQSPSRSLSGSLPNLSAQGSKPQTKLPSPRRSGSTIPPYAPTNLKKRFDSTKEKTSHQTSGLSSSFHHSPRPLRNKSPYRVGNQARVLAEINTCSSARMSPKCRVNQSETPRRGRSMLTEKENYM